MNKHNKRMGYGAAVDTLLIITVVTQIVAILFSTNFNYSVQLNLTSLVTILLAIVFQLRSMSDK